MQALALFWGTKNGGSLEFHSHSDRLLLQRPCVLPLSHCLLYLAENLHWHSAFPSAFRIHAVGGRSSQGGEDKQKTPRVSHSGRWSDQKRLLALFNRIETSISQQKSRNPNENNGKLPKDDDDASFQSVLEALSETPKKVGDPNKQASGVDQGPPEMEKMKLTQLREVAKARGIKGYSKLKKSELVDLLITQHKT